MAEVKAPYTQPQTYQLFTDTYLRTHRQRMDEALQMAMMELQNQKDLLAYYQKAEKNLTDYMEKVGTAGSGGKLSNKEFEQFMRVLAIEQKTNQALNDDIAKAISDVNKEYLVPQGATGSINTQAAQGAANLNRGISAIQSAARAVTGYSKGTNQAMAAAIAFFQQLEQEAARKGTSGKFNSLRSQIAQEIESVFNVGAQGGATVIQNPQAFETAKQNQLDQRKAETARRTLTRSQIKDAYKRAGITPSQETTSKTSETAKEQESLFASRIKTLQKKQDELEQKIAKSATAEGIYGRQTEIYNNRYKQTAKTRKQSKAIEAAMRRLSPQQIYMMEAMEASANVKTNPYFATGEEGGDVAQAKQLMDAMINNKGSGKPLDVIALSSKLADGNEAKAKKILGMAINGVVAHAQEQNPVQEIEQAQKDAVKAEIVQEQADAATVDGEKTTVELEATTLETAAPIEVPDAKFTPLQPPEGLNTTAATQLFEERIDMTTQPQVQKPKLNTNYLTEDGWGYVFTGPDTVRFVKKNGTIVGTFGKDTDQYKEAMEIFKGEKK